MHTTSRCQVMYRTCSSAEQEVYVLGFCCVPPCLAFLHLLPAIGSMLGSLRVFAEPSQMPSLKVPPLFATLSPCALCHSLGLSAESVSPLIQGFFWTALASMWKQVDWLILPGASGYLYFGFCWVIATRQLVWCPGRNSGQGAQYWFCCLGLCGLGQVSVSDGASACPFVNWRSWFNCLPVETVIIPLVLLSGFEGKQTPKQEAEMGNLQGGK